MTPSDEPVDAEDVRVIVVDDDREVAETLAAALEFDGYRVKIADNGAQAVALVAEFAPHCVLLDVEMPGMDGDELSKRLREGYGDEIVLIAVTGGRDKDKRVHDTFDRVDHYLKKPVDLDLLRRLLPRIVP
ncbi:MAG: response regulator [Pseudomonadota bacterium]|nr:response regulator [Pseudomonadota bacterium]